jgi:hypothetical protein
MSFDPSMLFDSANFAYWIFLGIGIFFFLSVILSGGGEDQDMDVDVDVDLDVDLDVDADIDTDVDTNAEVNPDADSPFAFLSILSWLGLGKAPLMILLAIDFSTWGLTGWILNVFIGSITGKIPQGGLGGLVFFVSLSFSLWIGRLLSIPIGKIFAGFGEDVEGDRLIGCSGIVASKKLPYLVEGRLGQVDVLDPARNLVTIEVSLPQWAKVIPHRGEEVLIIERQKHCYLAIAKDSSDQDKWLLNSGSRGVGEWGSGGVGEWGKQ